MNSMVSQSLQENIELSLDDVEPSTSQSISVVDKVSSQALDTLLDLVRRSKVHFVHCLLPRADALRTGGGGEGEAQGDGGDASSLMQLDVTLIRAQLRCWTRYASTGKVRSLTRDLTCIWAGSE
ncbi:hypothetical protein NHX12_010533 [Muraenolepis orangiensis]|uniref:Myosin motor domain-containing protein n=1 Tax=Muraenolepis orangiensis TaxID=630683 RepID=A0A9Q0I910_9TELE|nr:hypothetical protein NHX12_010533 [Muraenolepis orangiensis]